MGRLLIELQEKILYWWYFGLISESSDNPQHKQKQTKMVLAINFNSDKKVLIIINQMIN